MHRPSLLARLRGPWPEFKYTPKVLNILGHLNYSILRWNWAGYKFSTATVTQVHESEYSWSVRAWKFLFFCSFCQSSFELTQFLLHFNEYVAAKTIDDYLLHSVWLTGIMLGTSLFSHTIIYRRDIPQVMNQLFKLNDLFRTTFHNPHLYARATWKVDIFASLYFLLCLGAYTILIPLNIWYPHKHIYLTSLLPCVRVHAEANVDSPHTPYTSHFECACVCNMAILGMSVLETCVTSIVWSLGNIECFLNLYYVECMVDSLAALENHKLSLSTRQQYRLYRAIHVLNQHFNTSFANYVFPMAKLTFGSVSISALYSAMKLVHTGSGNILLMSLTLIITFVSMFIQSFLYPKAGRIGSMSRQVCKHEYRRSEGWAGVRALYSGQKSARAYPGHKKLTLCRGFTPFAVHVGVFYDMTPSSYLTFLHQIINLTLPLLMMSG